MKHMVTPVLYFGILAVFNARNIPHDLDDDLEKNVSYIWDTLDLTPDYHFEENDKKTRHRGGYGGYGLPHGIHNLCQPGPDSNRLCYSKYQCIKRGGVISGYCGYGYSKGYCCSFKGSCGKTTYDDESYFRNPSYPDATFGPINCLYKIVPKADTCGVRIDFMETLLAPAIDGACYEDIVSILNTNQTGYNAPFCGLLRGYSAVIPVSSDSTVEVVVTTQSKTTLWNIKVTQIKCSDIHLPDEDACGFSNGREGQPTTIFKRSSSVQDNKNSTVKLLPHSRDLQTIFKSRNVPTLPRENDKMQKIIGGQQVTPNHFPWMAALLLDNQLLCGATLLTHEWIVTASHCITIASDTPAIQKLTVLLGAHNITATQERNRVTRQVQNIVRHHRYQGATYDIALLKLNESVRYTIAVRPICLPNNTDATYAGLQGIITGWGATETTVNSPVLLAAFIPIVNNTVCASVWSDLGVEISDNMLCAGDGTTGTCVGDSGGPLFLADDGLYRIIGITSFGAPPNCASPTYPDVWTRVTSYLYWISMVLANNGTLS